MMNAAGYAINVIAIPFIARIYRPEDYADYAVVFPIASMLGVLFTLRYEGVLVVGKSDSIRTWAQYVSLTNLLTLTLLFSGMIRWMADVMGWGVVGLLRDYWLLVAWTIIAFGFQQICVNRMIALARFKLLGVFRLLSVVSLVGAQIGVGMMAANSTSLLIGHASGIGVPALLLLAWLMVTSKGTFRQAWLRTVVVYRKYRKFLFFTTPFTIAGIVRERFVYVLVEQFGNAVEASYFNMSFRMLNIPNMLVAGALRPVFFNAVGRGGTEGIDARLREIFQLFVVCVLPWFCLFIVSADVVFELVLGKDWASAAVYARVLCPAMFLLMATNWMDRIFEARGRQETALRLELWMTAISVSLLCTGTVWLDSLILGVSAQAAGMTILYFWWLRHAFVVGGFDLAAIRSLGIRSIAMAATAVSFALLLRELLGPVVGVIAGASVVLVGSLGFLAKHRARLLKTFR